MISLLASIHIGLCDLDKPDRHVEIEEHVRKFEDKENNTLPLQIGVDGSIADYPLCTTCCSLNDEVAHCISSSHEIKRWRLHQSRYGFRYTVEDYSIDVLET